MEKVIVLVEFKVGNFMSFYKVQTLSMIAGKLRKFTDRIAKERKDNILKFMSIYGANASGKSNIVAALGWFQRLVVEGFTRGSYSLYCKVDEQHKEEPTHFEIKIKIEKSYFVYGFDVIMNTASVVSEYLYEELKNGNQKSVFNRNTQKGIFKIGTYISSSEIIERLKIYGEDVKTDNSILFLKLMNQNKDSLYSSSDRKLQIFQIVFKWIKYNLDVNSPESTITNYLLLKDSKKLDSIIEKLKSFSTGVESFELVEISEEKIAAGLPKDFLSEIQQNLIEHENKNDSNEQYNSAVLVHTPIDIFTVEINIDGTFLYKTLAFKHQNSNSSFSISEESDGTIRLLNIIEVLVDIGNDKVYIIDEIDRTFHPLLTKGFVKEFLELAKNNNTQLIVTTHESQLMDLQILRKDEINFINKNNDSYSTIYSLMNYDDRFDKKILQEYFNGKYKAIPEFANPNI